MLLNSFLTDNFTFVNYGAEHGYTLLIWSVLGCLYIFGAKKVLTQSQSRKVLIAFSIFVLASQIMKICVKIYLGVFDITLDLPLHLCNSMPFMMPFAFYFNSRRLWAILFFWIMAGTFQALISPTLEHSFPHYEYHRYWNVHVGLVILALYPIFNYGYKLYLSDAILSAIFLNLLGLLMYGIDILLDANYMYMRAWPPGKTIYNLLGPWPIFHFSLEVVMFVLFGLLLLPFEWSRLQEKKRHATP